MASPGLGTLAAAVISWWRSPWPSAEMAETVNREELGDLGLTDLEILDIVAFLETLSDGYR